MIRRILLLASVLVVPLAPAFAATTLTFQQVVDNHIVPFVDNAIIPLLYVLAFLFFLTGLVRYFFTGGAENREVARVYIMWSLIGMVAIFAIWGIVRLLLSIIPGT